MDVTVDHNYTLLEGQALPAPRYFLVHPVVHLSEGSGQKQTNNQHLMTTVVSGGLPLQFWYQTSSRCIVHAFG